MASQLVEPQRKTAEGVTVSLTPFQLDVGSVLDSVKSPKAGAVVLFAGTTRDNCDGKPVERLQYECYAELALKTMLSIAHAMKEEHALTAIAVVHRLGEVPIGDESMLIAVSAPHRLAAWEAGKQTLEKCKEKVEIWKREQFAGGPDGGVWRANRGETSGTPANNIG